jgi:hypothetical protein
MESLMGVVITTKASPQSLNISMRFIPDIQISMLDSLIMPGYKAPLVPD